MIIKYILILILFSTLLICQDSYLGDLNLDNNVDVNDIVQLVDIILGTTPTTDQQLLNGDVNEDLILNIQDIVIIIEIILDQICPNYQNQCDPGTLSCCSSHDIEFEINTFGDYSNDIYDSWIFSDDYILAVGELFVVNEGDYSGVMWNGEAWQLLYLDYNSMAMQPRGIWAFDYDDIWFAEYSIHHWDGDPEHEVPRVWTVDLENYPDEGVWNIWASSPENMYFVGSGGCIIHYDGSDFIRMESGTDIWLKDVWGNVDPDTGEETVWASGYDGLGSTVLLVYRGSEWEPVYDAQSLYWEYVYDHISGSIKGVWATNNYLYVLSTNGLYQCPHDTQGEGTLILEGTWFVNYWHCVRGTGDNDIFVAGANNEVYHFNGNTWELITTQFIEEDSTDNIRISGNTVIIGGHRFEGGTSVRGLLLHGTRGER